MNHTLWANVNFRPRLLHMFGNCPLFSLFCTVVNVCILNYLLQFQKISFLHRKINTDHHYWKHASNIITKAKLAICAGNLIVAGLLINAHLSLPVQTPPLRVGGKGLVLDPFPLALLVLGVGSGQRNAHAVKDSSSEFVEWGLQH